MKVLGFRVYFSQKCTKIKLRPNGTLIGIKKRLIKDFNIASYFVAILTPNSQPLTPIYKDMYLIKLNIHVSCQFELFNDFNVLFTIIQTFSY